MKCPNCAFENPEDAASCGRCGIVLDFSRADLSRFMRTDPERPEPPAKGGGAAGCGIAGCVILAVAAIGLAVLAILAAIMFPVFFRAREKAASSSCMSNLKQLELAMLMYAQDYNETLPDGATWCDATMPYIKNQAVYTCPQVPGATGTYALNDGISGWKLSAVSSMADTVGICESVIGWNVYGGAGLVENRHNGGANIGFVDGHVKWVSAGSVSSLTWSPPPPVSTGAGP